MRRKLLLINILMLAAFNASAGSLSEGTWLPGGCGDKPPIPSLDPDSLDAFNASIETVNEWQRNAQAYGECLVKEANADTAAIVKTANEDQAKFQEAVTNFKTEAAAIRKSFQGE